jgi:hypothetical protein
MTGSNSEPGSSDQTGGVMLHLVDPRAGDIEDDLASPAQRSLFAIAGNLLIEISLPKLLFAWTMLLFLPAMLLGLAPLLITGWLAAVSAHILALTEMSAAIVLVGVLGLGWLAWRPLLRIAENNFWSLNALLVQPAYVFGSELLRHLAERVFADNLTTERRMQLRATSSAVAGMIICGCSAGVIALIWPSTRWVGRVSDLVAIQHLIWPTIANTIVVVSIYLAIASLIWGFADASMDQPADLAAFDAAASNRRTWRIAHLSDLHVVGERYGFRIESGRGGPRGNERLYDVLARLASLHAADPLDFVLVSGDMTDAGRATEWAEFLDAIARYPTLAARTIMLPGNHDLNIVDRSNPARLDLPFSPAKRLRQMRTLSALAAVQGDRVLVVPNHVIADQEKSWQTLTEALTPQCGPIVNFARSGGLRASVNVGHVFHDQFPMILMPRDADGLGIAILNSNAESHFSFTNALGLISTEQTHRLVAALHKFPQASWIVALHHHLLEYPMTAAFSERVGTALVNGSWFIRKLRPFAPRNGGDAWPSPHRLDRDMRVAEDHIGAVPCDGRDR